LKRLTSVLATSQIIGPNEWSGAVLRHGDDR
jgi:hypothetical protein